MIDESENKLNLRGVISLLLVVSFIGGGVSGAIVSQLAFSGGVPTGRDEDLTVRRAQTFVVEESSTIDTVGIASESVVSILIEKPASQATGNVQSPFNFFNIPGLELVPEQNELVPESDFEEVEEEEVFVQVGGGTGFVVNEKG